MDVALLATPPVISPKIPAELAAPAASASAPSAEEMAARAGAGCPEAFAALVVLHEARIFNYLFQITRNIHDAEDLTQVTFVKAYQSIRSFEAPRAFTPWLFTIA